MSLTLRIQMVSFLTLSFYQFQKLLILPRSSQERDPRSATARARIHSDASRLYGASSQVPVEFSAAHKSKQSRYPNLIRTKLKSAIRKTPFTSLIPDNLLPLSSHTPSHFSGTLITPCHFLGPAEQVAACQQPTFLKWIHDLIDQ